jgi:hypothetical protein
MATTSIPAGQARAQFTSDLVSVFTDQIPAPSFYRSFFPAKQSATRFVSVQVQRNAELVAVDVMRGTEGNRNNFAKSTEKIYNPPYYREKFDLTEIDLYDRLFGSSAIDSGIYSQLVETVATRAAQCRAKIERAYEKQIAEIFELGTVTLTNSESVNFGRKSSSLVDKGAGNYWATGTIDPFADLAAGCTFIRQYGKSVGHNFVAILGSQALADLYSNAIFQKRVMTSLSNVIDTVLPPQKNSVGGVYHGTLTAGAYRVQLWSYPESYDTSAGGTPTPYSNSKKVTILPENPMFNLSFAAVPQVLAIGGGTADMNIAPLQSMAYVVGNYTDPQNSAHIMDVKSAGLAIPVSVDRMYTVQVVA